MRTIPEDIPCHFLFLITQMMCCSALSTVVSLSSGQLLFWGSRYKTPPNRDSWKWLNPTAKRMSVDLSRQTSASSNRSRSLSQASLNGSQTNINRPSEYYMYKMYIIRIHLFLRVPYLVLSLQDIFTRLSVKGCGLTHSGVCKRRCTLHVLHIHKLDCSVYL